MGSDRSPDQKAEHLQQALDRFLEGVERRALVMAEMATGSRDEALDIVQDAMMRFVHSYARKPEPEWAPLFHRVLQNRIRDWYRRQSVKNRHFFTLSRQEGAIDPLDGLPAPPGHRPDSALEQANAVDRLVAGVAELPLRQRQAVMLRIWEGLDVAQTARAMGCSAGSVKTHLSRALKALRAKLEEHLR